uniref:Uncharacterized protein n=1 Tax=Timema poppense TaxID=170557 RepID=A0A7R9CW46_TIMPO|nr:unnamed protein product [Timema poppensis]
MAKASLARDVAAVARGETFSRLWEGVDRMSIRYLRVRTLLLEHLPYIETLNISRIRSAFFLKTLRVDTLTGIFLYAGSRNCIGQRFAMLEMKSTISKVLRTFKLLPGSSTNTIEELTAELVLKNIKGMNPTVLVVGRAMFSLIVTVCVCGVMAWAAYLYSKIHKMKELSEKIPGPPTIPLLGNARDIGATKLSSTSHGEEDVYQPRHWYFQILSFIDEQETPRTSISNIPENEESFEEPCDTEGEEEINASIYSVTKEPSTRCQSRGAGSRSSTVSTAGRASNLIRRPQHHPDEILDIIKRQLSMLLESLTRFDHLAQNWAEKLKTLNNPQQKLMAEKLINDVLFEAEISRLNISSHITTPNLFGNQGQSPFTTWHREEHHV